MRLRHHTLLIVLSLAFLQGFAGDEAVGQQQATDFQYPVHQDQGLLWWNLGLTQAIEGWTDGQDFQHYDPSRQNGIIYGGNHLGEDWNWDPGPANGRLVYACANGVVVSATANNALAGYVILRHVLPEGGYVLSIYGHLQSPSQFAAQSGYQLSAGQTVTKGAIIGRLATNAEMRVSSGNPSYSYQPHLHFEMRGTSAQTGLSDTNTDNGYDGYSGAPPGYFDPTDIYNSVAGMLDGSDWNPNLGFIEQRMPLPMDHATLMSAFISGGIFSLNEPRHVDTRGEFASMLVSAMTLRGHLSLPQPSYSHRFSDLSGNGTLESRVGILMAMGAVNASNSVFRVNDRITRAEAFAMVHSCLEHFNGTSPNPGSSRLIYDISTARPHAFYATLQRCAAQGLTAGLAQQMMTRPSSQPLGNRAMLIPDTVMRRGDTVKLMQNLLDRIQPQTQNFVVTPSAGANGSVSPSSAQSVARGTSVTFSATAASGHTVDTWYLDGSAAQTGTGSYTVTNVTTNRNVQVTFKRLPVPAYTVTASAGANGSISPAGSSTVNSSASITFNATPASGHVVDYWYVDGSHHATGGNSMTLSNVTANRSVQVTFKPAPVPNYTVTATAGANGSISPVGSSTVTSGGSLLLRASPASGHVVDEWYVDGSYQQTGGSTVTLTGITSHRSVHVSFKTSPVPTYSVTASAGANGSVSPAGSSTVPSGGSITYTATPATGYTVDAWRLDGSTVQTGNIAYTVTNVTAPRSVQVTFKAVTTPSTTISPTGREVSATASSYAITVTSNTSWSVTGLATWLTAHPTSGSGNGTVTVYYATNPDATARSDDFSIGGQMHSLTQAASPAATDDAYEPNDTYATSRSLAAWPNTWLSQISGPGQQRNVDYYTISVPSGALRVVVDLTLVHAGGDIDVELLSAAGSTLRGSYGVGNSEQIDHTVPASGSYFIRVFGPGNGNTYDLKWRTQSTAAPLASRATSPLPAKDATGIPVDDLTLGWGSGGNASNFSILLNTTGSFPAAGAGNGWQVALSTTTQVLGRTLQPGTTYYWRVDTSNDAATWTTGEVWSFTTSPAVFTVTASAGESGSISPAGAQSVSSGGSVTFTATPASGYIVDTWYVDGGAVQTGTGTCSLEDITSHRSVHVNFKPVPVPTCLITGSAGPHGSISPAGTRIIPVGGSASFTATPDAGYTVESWSVDGIVVKTGGTSHTLLNVGGNQSVEVTFAKVQSTLVGVNAYVRSAAGAPWNILPATPGSNEAAMDSVFGPGKWDDLRFETLDASTLFSSAYSVIFIEGSAAGTPALASFLQTHMTAMQNWVAAGGRLFLNAAVYTGNGMTMGFGVTLNYFGPTETSATDAHAVVPGHAIFTTPSLAAGPFTGNGFSSGKLSGTDLVNLVVADGNYSSLLVLGEKGHGMGTVIFGTLTLPLFHAPQPAGTNLRTNILNYLRQTQSVERTLSAVRTGGFRSGGDHQAANTSYFTGRYVAQNANATATETRSFFVFQIPDLRPGDRIVRAELLAHNPSGGFFSYEPTETLRLNHVSTPSAIFHTDTTAAAEVFIDLGDGVEFGSRTFTSADDDKLIGVPLNAAFRNYASLRGGREIVIGGEVTTVDPDGHSQFVFGSSHLSQPPQLSLTIEHGAVGADIAVMPPEGPEMMNQEGTVALGKAVANEGSSTVTITVKNAALASADLTNFAVMVHGGDSGDFAVDTSGMATSLAPGARTTFEVVFLPSATAVRRTTLSIASNDADESPFELSLTGTGTASGAVSAAYASAAEVPVTAQGYTAAGRTLNLTLNFAPATGMPLTVVNNTGLDFIFGTFENLAQGQAVALGHGGQTYHFVADYYGGTGNDLVLVWKDARVFGWGSNGNGALGDNSTSDRLVPTPASQGGALAGKTLVELAAGNSETLALAADGTLVAWGYDWSLGGNRPVPVTVGTAGTPLAGKTIASIASGGGHSFALCSDGTLAGWGYNGSGGLGINSQVSSPVPVAVLTRGTALEGKTVVAIAAGAGHSLALCSDGTLVAWGRNSEGQLGDGTQQDRPVPTAVMRTGSALAGRTVVAIAAGGYHNLVLCSDGTLVAWGYNTSGQAGDGSFSNRTVPGLVTTTGTPLAGKVVKAIAAGGSHSLALCTDGMLCSWGANWRGQLGDNSTVDRTLPVALLKTGTPLAGRTISSITAGSYHSVAQCTDGTMAAWGDNDYGQLGDGSRAMRKVPVQVSPGSLGGGLPTALGRGASAFHSLAQVALPLPGFVEIAVHEGVGTGGAQREDDVGTFHFVDTGTGTPLVQSFTIKNHGTALLTGLTVVKTAEGTPGDFAVGSPGSSTLAPGATATFTVTFTPSALGVRTAQLQIASNDPDESPFRISLEGTGVLPRGTLALALAPGALLTVEEGEGSVRIPLVRTAGSAGTVVATVSTGGGAATAPDDYAGQAAVPVSLEDGVTTLDFFIPIHDPDGTSEPNETFTVTLGGADLTAGGVISVTVRILDSADSMAPEAPVISQPAKSAVVELGPGLPITLRGSAADNKGVSLVTVQLNGGPAVETVVANPGAGTTEYALPLVPAGGVNTVTVQSFDALGQPSPPVTHSFTVKRPLLVKVTGSGNVSSGYRGSSFRQIGQSLTVKAAAATGPGAGHLFTGWTISGQDTAQAGAAFTLARLGIPASALEKPELTFTFREGLVLTANFTPNMYAPLAGSYSGLIRASTTEPDRPSPQADGTVRSNSTEGLFTASVQSTGAFSGQLHLDGSVLNVSGAFDADGQARFGTARAKSLTVARTGKPSLSVAFRMNLQAARTRDTINGTVTATAFQRSQITAVSTVEADRAFYNGITEPVPQDYLGTGTAAGVFTLVMPPVPSYDAGDPEGTQPPGLGAADYPQGYGIGTITVSRSGLVTVAGTLADGTAVSASASLAKNRTFPLYASLYGKQGFLVGLGALDAQQPDSDISSSGLLWLRPAITGSHYYPAGWPGAISVGLRAAKFSVALDAAAKSTLRAPGAGDLETVDVEGDGNAALSFGGGALSGELLKQVLLSPKDVVVNVPDKDPTFTLKVDHKTGVLSGTFLHTDGTAPSLKGVIYQKGLDAGGYGFFLTVPPKVIDFTGESGWVELIGEAQ